MPLIASFQDNHNLYLAMEYMVGGDFLGLLLRENILDEGVAQWYIAEMILCVEEAHEINWVHRDVKLDNFLTTSFGHLKISDSGLAFDGHWAHNLTCYNEQRYSLIRDLDIQVKGDAQDHEEGLEKQEARKLADIINGKLLGRVVDTGQYMAPEVIRYETYDGRCDWWSIGIILCEASSTSLLRQ